MRPSMKELYGVDPVTLRDLPAHAYHTQKIELLKKRRIEIVSAMVGVKTYEALSRLNATIMYLDKALTSNQSDLDELNGGNA